MTILPRLQNPYNNQSSHDERLFRRPLGLHNSLKPTHTRLHSSSHPPIPPAPLTKADIRKTRSVRGLLSLSTTTGGSSVLPFVPCTRLRKVRALLVWRATFRIHSIDLRRPRGHRRDVCSDLFAGSTTGTNGTKNMTLATRLDLKNRQQRLNSG